MMMQTRIVRPEEERQGGSAGIDEAARLLMAGELVAFPTETVYGLGGDARRAEAVRKIYEAKGRPAGNPLIVHVRDAGAARRWVAEGAGGWDQRADALARRFWPGALTMVLQRGVRGEGGSISEVVSAGRGTVALRCPAHPVAMALLERFGGPVAAPSANRSGFISPTTAPHVMAELNGRVRLILDGGPCSVGLESTVVDLSAKAKARILRPGAVTQEMLEGVLGGKVEIAGTVLQEGQTAASPGLYERHYAPRTAAYRFDLADWAGVRRWAEGAGKVALLTWSDEVALAAPHETLRLPGPDLAGGQRGGEAGAGGGEYARAMYAALREADALGVGAILVLMPPTPEEGMWAAVADRLRRATVELPIEAKR